MKTKRMLYYSLTALLIIAIVLGGALASLRPVAAATGIICEQFGTTTQGSYTIMNNRWGTTATQCINVTNNGFQITQQDGSSSTSGAPVSYPAIYVGCHYSICSPGTNLPMQISAINSANTSVTLTYSGSGIYDAAYDIWLNDTTDVSGVQKTEIMIWLNRLGAVQPIGSPVGNITLAGQSWQVWVGNNGANNVVSYLANSLGATTFTADVKPFLTDAITRGSGFGTTSWYLTSMQMGFEPWSGGVGLAVNSFSASINTPNTPVPPTATSGGGGGGGGTNVFRVNANGDITVNGTPIRVKGGSWFGLQGRHEPSTDTTNPSGAPMEQYMGNVFWNSTTRTYDQDIAEFKAMGINVIRLPLVTQTLTGTDPQGMAPFLKNTASVRIANSRLALETIIKKLDAAGIYVMLDIHSCSNYVDWRKGRLDARPPYADATRDNYDFKREDSSCAATNNPASVTRIQAYDKTKWLADLQTLANMKTTLGVSNIIGIDIYNEPWDYTWAEWKTLIEDAYTAINAVNTDTLIFAQGISATAGNQDGTPLTTTQSPQGSSGIDPNWGENLFEAGTNPPNIPKDRLVFSPHAYGPSVYVGKQFMDPAQPQCTGLEGDAAGDAQCNIVINPTLLEQGWEEHFGYLKSLGYAVVVGEWGGNMQWPRGAASLRDQARFSYITDNTIDEQWQNAFANYLVKKCIGDSTYWSINPESGDTGGLYTTSLRPGLEHSHVGNLGRLGHKEDDLGA